MFFIGICGASCSGKSTLAKLLSDRLGERCIHLRQDNYYIDQSPLPFEERCKVNYDDPDIFEHDALLADVRAKSEFIRNTLTGARGVKSISGMALKEGRSITSKGYDYAEHRRADPGEEIKPADVVIVEGIHAFFDPRLREMMDMKVYIQVDSDVCLLRRIKRDIRDRGRDVPSITAQYLATVKPMLDKYIRAYAQHADIILPGGGKNPLFLDMLCLYIDAHVPAANAQ